MTRRRADVELLRELGSIAKRVDRAAQRAARARPPRLEVVARLAHVLSAIYRAQDPIYDADPRLVPRQLRPPAYADVHAIADRLEDAEDSLVVAELVRQIVTLAPRLARARRETLVAWCRAQPRKFARVRPLDRQLDSPHRSVRFHAARVLAKLGAPRFWDATTGDIDRAVVRAWRRRGRRVERVTLGRPRRATRTR